MNSEELYNTYIQALEIVSKASAMVLEGFNKRKKVMCKDGAYDLVTEYDKMVEEFIKSELSKHFPTHKFLGEETSGSIIVPEDLTWVLDPIDGTNNFVHGCPESAISLALTIKKEPMIGIISCPMQHQLFSACKGRGSFLNGAPIHASSVKSVQETLVAVEMSLGSKSKELLERLGKRNHICIKKTHGVRCGGSAALGLAHVAQGIWDMYHTEGLKPWDVAAGAIIVTEAGGHVIDSLGAKFDIENSNILAANSKQIAESIANLFLSVE